MPKPQLFRIMIPLPRSERVLSSCFISPEKSCFSYPLRGLPFSEGERVRLMDPYFKAHRIWEWKKKNWCYLFFPLLRFLSPWSSTTNTVWEWSDSSPCPYAPILSSCKLLTDDPKRSWKRALIDECENGLNFWVLMFMLLWIGLMNSSIFDLVDKMESLFSG